MIICIYPRTNKVGFNSAFSKKFSCGKAFISKVGSAELIVDGVDLEDLPDAFTWIQQNITESNESSVSFYAFLNRDSEDVYAKQKSLIHMICDKVVENNIDFNTSLLSGISKSFSKN